MSGQEHPLEAFPSSAPLGSATSSPVPSRSADWSKPRPSNVRHLVHARVGKWERMTRLWAADVLPRLNMGILGGINSVDELVRESRAVLADLDDLGVDALATTPRPLARRCLEVLGFIALSIERHTQAAGSAPGGGLARIPSLEDALALAGMAAELPPTLGYTGYWLDNGGAAPLTFTGDPQERFFRNMVVAVNDAHSRAVNLLRPVASGELPVVSDDAVWRLTAAAEAEERVHECYRRFRPIGPTAREHFSVAYFRDVMRTFLVMVPIHGVTLHGPNAANIAAQASLDYVVGIVEPFYRRHVEERMRYMSPEERAQVAADMRNPSVLDRLLDVLRLTPADVRNLPIGDLTRRVRDTPGARDALAAFSSLKHAAGRASGAHFGLIVHYLQRGTGCADTNVPVAPSHGTGGRSHGETQEVMRMRQREPVSTTLVSTLKCLDPSPRALAG